MMQDENNSDITWGDIALQNGTWLQAGRMVETTQKT